VLDANDTDEDLSAMRGIFAVAIRSAEILGTDPELRGAWAEVLAHLAPLPTSDEPGALVRPGYAGPRVWVRGIGPAASVRGFLPDANSDPMWFFDLCNLDSPDAGRLAIARATFQAGFRGGLTSKTPISVLSKTAIAGATLGIADATRFLVPNQIHVLTPERSTVYRSGGVLANRLTLREGPQAFDAQRLGRAAEALQLALLNSTPPEPGRDPIIRLFAAWPAEWDATFTLRARGAFVITASQHGGQVGSVEILSEAGATCRLHNPWGDRPVGLQREGGALEQLSGAILTIATRPGERFRLIRS
jgi:hypothetical protein